MNRWLSTILVIYALVLAAGHSLWPETVTIDSAMAVPLAVALLLVLAPLLESADIPFLGKWQFRTQIEKTKKVTGQVELEAEERVDKAARERSVGASELFNAEGVTPVAPATPEDETRAAGDDSDEAESVPDVQDVLNLFTVPEHVRILATEDPNYALAGLRMAIEAGVRSALAFLAPQSDRESRRTSLAADVRRLHSLDAITDRQMELLRRVIELCNRAIHGVNVNAVEASEVFQMADTLNWSFALGYSLDFSANSHWREQGLLCKYEHCIEQMPIEESTAESCPVFGHDCPGGQEAVAACEVAASTQTDGREGCGASET